MSTTPPDPNALEGDTSDITVPPVAQRHPQGHGVLDTLEIAALDEILHEAALRDSALRPPR
ncbi:hypothetical protein [Dyella tabacisoli]|uniref:Uncharacterized protein n=1 Tax=Dyella tabacisoli TaxID=2282381 RepID=A0A369UJW2_9GAMM|nr:hypothetical protein [Dyella tabacisoli]RDD80807.1 hypothetical protein DVJ77_15225 [Dyella tabacisoli]